jgi:hypothetical protein
MNYLLTASQNFGSITQTSDDDLATIEITANGNTFDISVQCKGFFEAETDMTWQEASVNLEWLMTADWTLFKATRKYQVVQL